VSDLEDFDKLWDYNEPAGTEQKFRALLARSDEAPQSYRLQLMTQIARTLGLQRRFEEAHTLLDEVEAALSPEMKVPRVRYLLERGRAVNSSGKRRESQAAFVEVFEVASNEGLDFYAVDAAHMLGVVEASAEQQIRWNEMALALAEKSADPRAKTWAGALYNNAGWTRFEQKEYAEALDLFQRGVEFRAGAKQPRELRIAKYAVARTLRAMNRIDEAHQLMKQVCDEAAAVKEQDGYFDEEMAEVLLILGKSDEARPLFARAFRLLGADAWTAEHEAERLERLKRLGT
jgi:tetratricopeptide (TPR) repeat protein